MTRVYKKKKLTLPKNIPQKALQTAVSKALRKTEEVKNIDVTSTGLAVSYAGTQVALIAVAQGQANGQRVGDNVRVRSAHITLTWAIADATNIVRCIVYQWHPLSTGSAPVPGSILEHTSDALAAISPYVVNNDGDYSILYDKTIQLSAVSRPAATVDFWITGNKFLKRDVHYSAGSSSVQKNGLFLLFVSDSSAAAHPQVIFHARMRYTDS